jgi:hypothetical protein
MSTDRDKELDIQPLSLGVGGEGVIRAEDRQVVRIAAHWWRCGVISRQLVLPAPRPIGHIRRLT